MFKSNIVRRLIGWKKPRFVHHLESIPRRSQCSLFFGRYQSDSFHQEFPNKVIVDVEKALSAGEKVQFSKACFDFIRHLEKIDNDHPLWLNQEFMFNGQNSYLHDSYDSVFRMCFMKTLSAVNPGIASSSNFSGHYFVGPSGVGKSVLLQTSCLVTGQLLPKLVTIYIDASINREHKLRHQLALAVNDKTRNMELPLLDPKKVTINDILARAAAIQCAIGLFIDEAHCFFSNKSDWPDILACISSFRCAVFLSGSDNMLPPCVKLRNEDKKFLKSLEIEFHSHESLNTTKLTQKVLTGFTSPRQYLAYFKTRPQTFRELFPSLKTLDPQIITLETETSDSRTILDEVRDLHSLTAGRMRAMHALRNGGVDVSAVVDFAAGSITSSDSKHLMPFFSAIEQSGEFNPFDLPRLPIGDGDGAIPSDVVFPLIQKKLLTYASVDSVTLSSPAVYLLANSKPTVFISHAECDKDAILPMVGALQEFAHVTCSASEQSRVRMTTENSLRKWKEDQIHKIGVDKNHYGIVVLSKAYCEKVDRQGDTGCAREWKHLQTKVQNKQSVIYSYIGKFDENVVGETKQTLGDQVLLKFQLSDLITLFSRLLSPI